MPYNSGSTSIHYKIDWMWPVSHAVTTSSQTTSEILNDVLYPTSTSFYRAPKRNRMRQRIKCGRILFLQDDVYPSSNVTA